MGQSSLPQNQQKLPEFAQVRHKLTKKAFKPKGGTLSLSPIAQRLDSELPMGKFYPRFDR
jgi:hypothetical protein